MEAIFFQDNFFPTHICSWPRWTRGAECKEKGTASIRIPGIFRTFFFFCNDGGLVAIIRCQHIHAGGVGDWHLTVGIQTPNSLETSCASLPHIQTALGTTRCACRSAFPCAFALRPVWGSAQEEHRHYLLIFLFKKNKTKKHTQSTDRFCHLTHWEGTAVRDALRRDVFLTGHAPSNRRRERKLLSFVRPRFTRCGLSHNKSFSDFF